MCGSSSRRIFKVQRAFRVHQKTESVCVFLRRLNLLCAENSYFHLPLSLIGLKMSEEWLHYGIFNNLCASMVVPERFYLFQKVIFTLK